MKLAELLLPVKIKPKPSCLSAEEYIYKFFEINLKNKDCSRMIIYSMRLETLINLALRTKATLLLVEHQVLRSKNL